MPIPWDQLDVTLGVCGRVRCEPGWSLAADWSEKLDDFDLWFVWAGRGRMQLIDRTIDLHPGIVIWARPGGLYIAQQDLDDRLGVNFIHFDLRHRRSSRRLDHALLPPNHHQVRDIGFVDAAMQHIINHRLYPIRQPDLSVDAHLLRALLIDIESETSLPPLASRSPAEQIHHQIIMTAVSRIRESPSSSWSVQDLARDAHYSVDHYIRLFQKVTGHTPASFIVQARIERARQLLAESSLSIAQIADILNYRDIYFFSRQFKQKTGLSPSQYRLGTPVPHNP